MNRTFNGTGIIGLFAAVVLAVALFAAPAYALETNEHVAAYSGGTYVSIGDSIAAGFDISTHRDAGGKPIEGSFANIVAEALDMDEVQLAYAGFRTDELLRALGDDTEVDDFANFAQSSLWKNVDWETYPDEVLSNVRQADLLTLEVGGNDLFTTPIYTALLNVMSENAVTEEQKAAVAILTGDDTALANVGKVVEAMKEMGCYEQFAEELISQLKVSTTSFRTKYEKVLSRLKEECPGTVMILGLYNPYSSMSLELCDDVTIKLSTVFSAAVADYNLFVRIEAQKYGFTYVNISDTTSFASDVTSPIKALSSDIHPNSTGHEQIAQSVVDALPHQFSSSVVAPRCLLMGWTEHTCVCGESYADSFTAPVGHTWETSRVVEPTRFLVGYTVYQCSECGMKKIADLVPRLKNAPSLARKWALTRW